MGLRVVTAAGRIMMVPPPMGPRASGPGHFLTIRTDLLSSKCQYVHSLSGHKERPLNASQKKGVGWFCVWSQPKHEHIAAAHLRAMEGVQVFLPRIRFQRSTRLGVAWVTEALFPGYLFARFDWRDSLRRVQSANGVRGVVRFGEHWPEIPEQVIAELQQVMGTDELQTISPEVCSGDHVRITGGVLRGLRAVVSRLMPSGERVGVLLDFLGRQTLVEMTASSLLKDANERSVILPRRDDFPS
jgi:transcriptional antiterminator RfaH